MSLCTLEELVVAEAETGAVEEGVVEGGAAETEVVGGSEGGTAGRAGEGELGPGADARVGRRAVDLSVVSMQRALPAKQGKREQRRQQSK
jgi:hypothetical protein